MAKRKPGKARFFKAIEEGDGEALAEMIAAGADLTARKDDCTPLSWAILYAQPEVAVQLVDAGAAADDVNTEKSTPLHTCATARDLSDDDAVTVAAKLLEHDADVAAKDIFSETPLTLAQHRKKTKLAKLLKKHGAK